MRDEGAVVDLFGREPSRVRLLVSDRAPALLTGGAADRPGDGTVICRCCGSTAALGTVEVCLWWPFGCTTRDREPYPRLCWDCCNEDEQCDLVDVGCLAAAWRRMGWPGAGTERTARPGGLVRVPGRS